MLKFIGGTKIDIRETLPPHCIMSIHGFTVPLEVKGSVTLVSYEDLQIVTELHTTQIDLSICNIILLSDFIFRFYYNIIIVVDQMDHNIFIQKLISFVDVLASHLSLTP